MELKLDRNKTYGLALEGGGAKGAYQIGAWKALREAGIRFSAVSNFAFVSASAIAARPGSFFFFSAFSNANSISVFALTVPSDFAIISPESLLRAPCAP